MSEITKKTPTKSERIILNLQSENMILKDEIKTMEATVNSLNRSYISALDKVGSLTVELNKIRSNRLINFLITKFVK